MICPFNIYKLRSCRVPGTGVGIGATQQITKYVLGSDKCSEENISKEGDWGWQGCAIQIEE